jgi:hypothetical protein
MACFFLVIITLFSASILAIIVLQNRNAWDALFLNSTIALVILFMIGLLVNDKEVWLRVIGFIGVVATGSAIASVFIKNNQSKNKKP